MIHCSCFSQDLTPKLFKVNDITYFGFTNEQANVFKKSLLLNVEYEKQLQNYSSVLQVKNEITINLENKNSLLISSSEIQKQITNSVTEQYHNQIKITELLQKHVKKKKLENKVLKIGLGVAVTALILKK
jgi:methyltransferase-like protein